MRIQYFDSYHDCQRAAQAYADEMQREVGIEASGRGFRFFLLPASKHRTGFELRCEVVTPRGKQPDTDGLPRDRGWHHGG